MKKWFGKTAIVTGSSAGIGKDISLKLVEHGLKVIGCGRNMENLIKLKDSIPKDAKGEFIPVKCDVRIETEVLNMFKFVKTNFTELSILINNAGVAIEGSILNGKTENWKSIFETNVLGLCMCTREAFSLMREKELSNLNVDEFPGHIINIGSIAGHEVFRISMIHFYSASKFSVAAINEGIRQELREIGSNIRVTEISPGYVDTDIFYKSDNKPSSKTISAAIGEPLQPSDVTSAVIFALSQEARSSIHEIIIRQTNEIRK